jgi:tetratricopeptide (TPR) repeat protein
MRRQMPSIAGWPAFWYSPLVSRVIAFFPFMCNPILTSGSSRKCVDFGYIFVMSQTSLFGCFFDVSLREVDYIKKRDYDKAIADYSEVIRLDAGYAEAYHNRGTAWARKREYDKAIADYNEAIRLDAGYAEAYYNRGLTWYYKKDYGRARADWEKALQIDPGHVGARDNLEFLERAGH